MNKLNKILAVLFILSGTAFLGGCIKESGFDIPPENIRVNFSSNTTISELKAMHTAGGLEPITTDVIIKGIVVANDKSGNFSKKLFLQDDSAGIEIDLEQSDLYSIYAVGQCVYVKCNGLGLGEYNGTLELGCISGGSIGRIPLNLIPKHLFLDSLPGNAPNPVSHTIPELADSDLYMLVKFDSVSFSDAGVAFSTLGNTLIDKNNNTVTFYTKTGATFASALTPSGIGSATGILFMFDGSYELMIRDLNDLQGFDQ